MNIIKAKKSLGQNFLVDDVIREKIVSALNIEDGDFILEIGPGTGSLTELLLEKKCDVKVIEIDKRAIMELEKLKNVRDFEIINANILKFNFDDLKWNNQNKKIKVLGNLPYYISSQIIFHLFDYHLLLDKCVIMLQREMAARVIGKVNTKDYGLITINSEIFAESQYLFNVPPTSFIPQPKIYSSVVEMKFKEKSLLDLNTIQNFRGFIKAAFNQRRKMLSNSIGRYFLPENKVFGQYKSKRPENLTTEQFIELYYSKDIKG